MKRILCLLAMVGLLFAFGCGPKAPEDAAKQFIDQQILKHKGMELDTSDLTYKVVEKDGNSAVVAVSGNIAMKAEVPLEKKAGMWMVKHPQAAEKVAAKAPHEAAREGQAKKPEATEEKLEKEKTPAHEGSHGGHQ